MATPPRSDARSQLRHLLESNADLLVAAIGSGPVMAPMPPELAVDERRVFAAGRPSDVLTAGDQLLLVSSWARAQSEPVVRFEVRLRAAPAEPAVMSIFDLRADHGVHIVVVETPHGDDVVALARKLAVEAQGVARVRRDAVGEFIEVDEATTAMLGWPAEELVGRRTVDFVHPDDLERAIDSWMSMRAGRDPGRARVRFRHRDGRYVWVEVANESRLDDPGHADVLSEMVDISAEMAELEALHERERLLQRLADALPVGVCQLRLDGSIAYANAPFAELLGPVDGSDALVRAVSRADRAAVAAAVERACAGEAQDLEVSVMHGLEERRCHLAMNPTRLDDGRLDGVVVCAGDITDPYRLRSELEHRASHDALSGCLNRAATLAALERSLREASGVTVAYLDIDDFKSVNDSLGHAAGDEVLRVVAARLRSAIRTQDTVGRMGGDEFVVICPQAEAPLGTVTVVERITTAVAGEIRFANQLVVVSVSVGAASSHDGPADANTILQRADAAMYRSKRAARARRTTGSAPAQL